MMRITITILIWMLVMAGCAKVPGKSSEERIGVLEQLHDKTLEELYRDDPNVREQIAQSAGYAIMDNSIVKIPLVGAGSGYGIAVDNATGKHIYIKMVRFDFGAGWGARDVRPVLIIYDRKEFENFVSGKWIFDAGAEASAKAGDYGVAGGAGTSGINPNRTYDLYMITDAGVSATFSAAVIHVRPVTIQIQRQN